MDYNHVANFLEKFKNILFQKEEINNIVIQTISKEISHQIQTSDLKIKNGFIYINGSPILKSEIMLHKKQILNKLKEILPKNIFLDIK
jgi:hypothetical protein